MSVNRAAKRFPIVLELREKPHGPAIAIVSPTLPAVVHADSATSYESISSAGQPT